MKVSNIKYIISDNMKYLKYNKMTHKILNI